MLQFADRVDTNPQLPHDAHGMRCAWHTVRQRNCSYECRTAKADEVSLVDVVRKIQNGKQSTEKDNRHRNKERAHCLIRFPPYAITTPRECEYDTPEKRE